MTNSKTMLFGLLGLLFLVSNVLARDGHIQSETHRSKQPVTPVVQQQLVELSVTSEGFVPAIVKVHAGQPVKLVVTRKIERTCATDIVIKEYGINKPLPLNVPVEVVFTPKKPGRISYSCAMNMIKGEIVAE
jgi:plastocyanin domain-containing protein